MLDESLGNILRYMRMRMNFSYSSCSSFISLLFSVSLITADGQSVVEQSNVCIMLQDDIDDDED